MPNGPAQSAPTISWATMAATAPQPGQPQEFFMDRVAGGKFKDTALWVTLLRVAAWVMLVLGFIGGLVYFFSLRSVGESFTYLTRSGNPFTGVAVMTMLGFWIMGAIMTTVLMVVANIGADISRTRQVVESRR
jgi:preprotein translocase subunit Sss1